MVPKIIHYTWFSGDEMPQILKDCMASWKQYLSDYEFRLWDMNAIKDIDSVFLKEALSVRKWAYAADYVRLYALEREGGIYLDTDVLVLKSFDDLLANKVFIGKEDTIHELPMECKWANYLTSHCMGAEPHAEYIKDCLRYFENRHFILSADEELPQRLRYNYVLLPYIQAVIAREYGYDWDPRVQTVQHCKDGLTVYPSDSLNGFKYLSSSYCQHLAQGSWREGYAAITDLNALPSKLTLKKRVKRFLAKYLLDHSYVIHRFQ